MTILDTPRSRLFVFKLSLVLFCILALLANHRVVSVHAAKQAVLKENARVVAQRTAGPEPASARTPVLVELFTSEGCSSCPPADALLASLDRNQPVPNADIIVLGEHVDYWDSLGWKDRFSSAESTLRQRNYQAYFHLGDSYTPQIVVNGSAQFNGTDRAGIENAIEQAVAAQPAPIQFGGVQVRGKSVAFTLLNGPATHPEYVNIYAALVDPSDTTEVRAGENGGRTLHHAGVVRAFSMVGGSWHMRELGRHPEAPFSIQFPGQEVLEGKRLVVFAQTKHIGPVLGSASCLLVPASAAAAAPLASKNPCPALAPDLATR